MSTGEVSGTGSAEEYVAFKKKATPILSVAATVSYTVQLFKDVCHKGACKYPMMVMKAVQVMCRSIC